MLPRSVPGATGAAARPRVGAFHLETAYADDDDGKDKYGGGIGGTALAAAAGEGGLSPRHRRRARLAALVLVALCAGAAALGALSSSGRASGYDPLDPMSGPPPSAERWRARRAWQQSPEGQLWKRAPARVPEPNEERPPVDLQHEHQKQDMQALQARQAGSSEDQQQQQQQEQQQEQQQQQGPPPKPSTFRAFRVLCFGDGLTAGSRAGGAEPHPYAMAMAEGLKQRFGSRYGSEPPLEVDAVVRGEPGETLLAVVEEEGEGAEEGGDTDNNDGGKKKKKPKATMGERLERLLKEEEEAGRRFDAVVIMGGSNDLFSHDKEPRALLEGVRALWRRARRGHGAPTLVLTLPPDGAPEGKEQRDRDRAELNQMIVDNVNEIVSKEKEVQEQQEQGGEGGGDKAPSLAPLRAEDIAPILTYSSGSPGDYFDDEVHFSRDGSDRLGDHVAHGIVEMGALEPYREKRLEADAAAAAAAEAEASAAAEEEEQKEAKGEAEQQQQQEQPQEQQQQEGQQEQGEQQQQQDQGEQGGEAKTPKEEGEEGGEAAAGTGGGGDDGGGNTPAAADNANTDAADGAAATPEPTEGQQQEEQQQADADTQQQKEEGEDEAAAAATGGGDGY